MLPISTWRTYPACWETRTLRWNESSFMTMHLHSSIYPTDQAQLPVSNDIDIRCRLISPVSFCMVNELTLLASYSSSYRGLSQSDDSLVEFRGLQRLRHWSAWGCSTRSRSSRNHALAEVHLSRLSWLCSILYTLQMTRLSTNFTAFRFLALSSITA